MIWFINEFDTFCVLHLKETGLTVQKLPARLKRQHE